MAAGWIGDPSAVVVTLRPGTIVSAKACSVPSLSETGPPGWGRGTTGPTASTAAVAEARSSSLRLVSGRSLRDLLDEFASELVGWASLRRSMALLNANVCACEER